MKPIREIKPFCLYYGIGCKANEVALWKINTFRKSNELVYINTYKLLCYNDRLE